MKTLPWADLKDSRSFSRHLEVVIVDRDGHWWGPYDNVGAATKSAMGIASRGDTGRLKVPMSEMTLVPASDWPPLRTLTHTGQRLAAAADDDNDDAPQTDIQDGVSLDEAQQLGDAIGVDFSVVDLEQFRIGIAVEREHTDVVKGDPEKVAQIAYEHLLEVPDYYTKLGKLVEKLPSPDEATKTPANTHQSLATAGENLARTALSLLASMPGPIDFGDKPSIEKPTRKLPDYTAELRKSRGILAPMKAGPQTPEQIARYIGLPLRQVKLSLTRLILIGAVRPQQGKYILTSVGLRALAIQGAAVVPTDSKGKEIQVGDFVRPDYSRPGWRLKNLKRGKVVAFNSAGQPIIQRGNHSAPMPGKMILVERSSILGSAPDDRVDQSENDTVVEYAMREVAKNKSPKAAASYTAKKLSGGSNMFIGPGITHIDPVILERAIWRRMAQMAKGWMVKRGLTADSAASAALQYYYGLKDVEGIEKKYLKPLLQAIAHLGHSVSSAVKPGITRSIWKDGRLRPQIGDQVYQVARGPFGTPTTVHGIVKQSKGKLVVQLTKSQGMFPAGVNPNKLYVADEAWTVAGDPAVAAKRQEREAGEAEKAARKAEIQNAAASAVEKKGHHLGLKKSSSLHDVSVGDTIYQITSQGQWGSGNPDQVAVVPRVVTEVTPRYVVYHNEHGGESTLTTGQFWIKA